MLFSSATRALCESAGFGRAAVFSLQGGTLVAESVYPADGNGPQPYELGPGLRETEVLRRRTAVLVEDVSADPRAVGMLEGAGSFVAAPIICQEQAVGLIHADRGADRSAGDRARPGHAGRIRRGVRLRARAVRALGAACAPTPIAYSPWRDRRRRASPSSDSHEFALGSSAVRFRAARSGTARGCNGLLTRRELEVVAMLAEGETNARIARRLVVSEDTVKSHVKHILRKLDVHNRSQAVSRYFQAQAAS